MKNMIRSLCLTLVVLGCAVVTSFAASTEGTQGGSLLLSLFIGFFALIVVFQLVPAVLLFVGIVKGLFSRKDGVEQKSSSH